MCIARFSLSQLPQLASGLPLDDGLTKGPVNRAVSTTSPSATACQRSYPSGTRSPGDSFSPFLSPWALVMCRTTHMGTSSVLITLTKLCKTSRDPEICFLLLRFNRNEKKKNRISTYESPWIWKPRKYFLLLLGIDWRESYSLQPDLCEECGEELNNKLPFRK